MKIIIKFWYVVLWILLIFDISNGQKLTKTDLEKENGLTLCKIEVNPEVFIDKELEIDAVYVSGFEMGWLEDVCSCDTLNRTPFKILYEFDEDFKKRTDKKVLSKIDKIFRKKLKPPATVHKLQGRFTVQIAKYKKKNDYDTRADYVITVLKVISVDK